MIAGLFGLGGPEIIALLVIALMVFCPLVIVVLVLLVVLPRTKKKALPEDED
jgi:hypothetical protein